MIGKKTAPESPEMTLVPELSYLAEFISSPGWLSKQESRAFTGCGLLTAS